MLFTIAMLLGQAASSPPALETVRAWFEAGQHQDVIAIPLASDSAPALIYQIAQSHDRLEQAPAARAAYGRLAARPAIDAWHFIGRAATLLADGQTAEAVTAAQQAVTASPDVAAAHYQLGLAQAARLDYEKAAPAFEAAISVIPTLAYAHYYAGLSYYQAERVDLMARYFESFLRLAPNAPERPQVESVMRTIRGRR